MGGVLAGIKKITTSYNGKTVVAARIVGVRTAQDTKVLATYNYGVYSILVQYDTGEVELVEEQFGSPGLKILVKYMQV